MFATLDPTVRAIRLPSGRRALLSDTVGFIRDLPKPLITAFRATLEEVQESALILHVSDVSNPSHEQLNTEVKKILDELGVSHRPVIRVFNKVDRLSTVEKVALAQSRNGNPDSPIALVSGLTGEGLDALIKQIDAALPVDPTVTLSLRLPLADGKTLALLHALGKVLHSEVDDSHMRLDAEIPASVVQKLRLGNYAARGTSRRSSA